MWLRHEYNDLSVLESLYNTDKLWRIRKQIAYRHLYTFIVRPTVT